MHSHSKVVVHYNYETKLFGFGSSNIDIVLYLMLLKIAI